MLCFLSYYNPLVKGRHILEQGLYMESIIMPDMPADFTLIYLKTFM